MKSDISPKGTNSSGKTVSPKTVSKAQAQVDMLMACPSWWNLCRLTSQSEAIRIATKLGFSRWYASSAYLGTRALAEYNSSPVSLAPKDPNIDALDERIKAATEAEYGQGTMEVEYETPDVTRLRRQSLTVHAETPKSQPVEDPVFPSSELFEPEFGETVLPSANPLRSRSGSQGKAYASASDGTGHAVTLGGKSSGGAVACVASESTGRAHPERIKQGRDANGRFLAKGVAGEPGPIAEPAMPAAGKAQGQTKRQRQGKTILPGEESFANIGDLSLDQLRSGLDQQSDHLEDGGDDNAGGGSRENKRILDLPEFLAQAGIDYGAWEVRESFVNQREIGEIADNGDLIAHPIHQFKVKLRPRKDMLCVREEIKRLVQEAKAEIPAYAPIDYSKLWAVHSEGKREGSGLLAEFSVYDHHFSKRCQAHETGWAEYNLERAIETFDEAIDALLEKSQGYNYERILFPLGNDLLNFDNLTGGTTRGTPQSNDTNYYAAFLAVKRVAIRSIERLRQVAPVSVVMVPGNHDQLSVFHLGEVLDMRFHDCPGVTVDNAPTLRKYIEWGQCMFLLTHGDKKAKDLGSIAAAEMPGMWGRTLFREAHIGHLHQQALLERNGFKIRWLPSLVPTDAWHAQEGYVGNLRSAQVLIWSQEDGEVGTCSHTLPHAWRN